MFCVGLAAFTAPENLLFPTTSRGSEPKAYGSHRSMADAAGVSKTLDGSWYGRCATNSGGPCAGVQSGLVALLAVSNPSTDYPRRPIDLTEGARFIEYLAGFKDVIAGACQFMRHRLDRNDLQSLGGFLLIPTLNLFVVTHRKVCGLHKGPG